MKPFFVCVGSGGGEKQPNDLMQTFNRIGELGAGRETPLFFCSFGNRLSEDGFCTQSRLKANEFQRYRCRSSSNPKKLLFFLKKNWLCELLFVPKRFSVHLNFF